MIFGSCDIIIAMIDKNDEIMGRNKERMGRWNTIPGYPEKPYEPNDAASRENFNAKAQRGQPQPKTEGEQKQTKETKWEGPWKNTWELENYSSFPAFASVQTLV